MVTFVSLAALTMLGSLVTATQMPWTTRDPILYVEEWEAIGPFPLGMREHPFIESPAYVAFDHSRSHDRQFIDIRFNTTIFPSYLCPSGIALWKSFYHTPGYTSAKISYEELDWRGLRRDKGWEGTQFQSLLRGNFTIPTGRKNIDVDVEVEIQLLRGQEFAIFAREERDAIPHLAGLGEWHSGNIYGLAPPSPLISAGEWHLPHRTTLRVGVEYVVFIKAIYEVRLFGDPGPQGPVIDFDFQIRIKRSALLGDGSGESTAVEVLHGLNLLGDVLDGWILGSHIGIGLQGAFTNQELSITEAKVIGKGSECLSIVQPHRRFRLVDRQARLFVFEITQAGTLDADRLSISITYEIQGHKGEREIEVTLPLVHHTWTQRNETTAWRFTHTYPSSTITYGMLLPPTGSDNTLSTDKDVTILALHGAGVQAHSRMWTDEIPRRENGWAVVVTGGNEWGMDWHGISMEGSRTGLKEARKLVAGLAQRLGLGSDQWRMADQTVVLGHSNGGQGANHLASHYPDEFIGLVQAAGYLKVQDYVSYNSWTSRHFADPMLISILDAALTPCNNPVYASNLVGLPVLTLHGNEDDNVPLWHSRAVRELMLGWDEDPEMFSMDEVNGEKHFWDGVLKRESVTNFLANMSRRTNSPLSKGFTLTTANPAETGSKSGIKIVEVDVPGRIARVVVLPGFAYGAGPLRLITRNVRRMSLDLSDCGVEGSEVTVDGATFTESVIGETLQLVRTESKWERDATKPSSRASGPMSRILSSSGPLCVVYGGESGIVDNPHKALALRLAHDLHLYQGLDVEVLHHRVALQAAHEATLGNGNIVTVGHPETNLYTRWLLERLPSSISWPSPSTMKLDSLVIEEPGTGMIALLPRPVDAGGLVCIVAGTDVQGVRRASKLLSPRTGIPVPDWVAIGPTAEYSGAGGIIGVGFWSRECKWSPIMSYLS